MNNKLYRWLTLAACIGAVCMLSAAVNAEEDETVRVGIFDYQAFYGTNFDGAPYGYGYEYLETLARYGGYQYEYVYGSWPECLEMLEKGEIDMLDSAQRYPQHEDKFLFSDYSTGTSYGELFVKSSSSLLYNDFCAMNGMLIGMLEQNSRNQTFLNFAAENGFSVKTTFFNTEAELSSALQEEIVDGIVSSNLRQGKNERSIARFSPAPFFLMFNTGKPELKKSMDVTLEEILVDIPNFNAELNEKYYSSNQSSLMLTKEEHTLIDSAPVMRVAYDGDCLPFSARNAETQQAEGIHVDVVNLIGEKTGLRFDYLPADGYEQAADMLKTGKADILLGFETCYQQENEPGITATDDYLNVPFCYVGRSFLVGDSPVFAVSGSSTEIIAPIQEQFPDGSVTVMATARDCYQAVIEGQANFAVDNIYTATRFIQSRTGEGLMISFASPAKEYYSLAVRNGIDPALIKILNKGIAAISQSEMTSVVTHHTVNQIAVPTLSMLADQYRPHLMVTLGTVVVLIICGLLLLWIRQKKNKRRLWQTAYMDSLTGIGNLNLFKEELRERLDNNEDANYVVYKFDIENLKLLNEIYGFERGDSIIQSLAYTLGEDIVPEMDAFARISGDDFILLEHYIDCEENKTLRQEREQKFFKLIGHEFDGMIKLRYGVYYIEDHHESVASVLEKANYAHSICKASQNRNEFVYDESVKQSAIEEKKIEARMEEALLKRQFMLYLQPKYFLKDETLAGAEALVRWCSEDGATLVYPNSFIPLFEKNGFITKLDMYMLERSCELICKWMDSGITPVTISINFSRLHLLNPTFTQEICEITDRFAIPRKYIEIELTESAMFNNEEAMFAVLEKLHEAGFTLSMDDFGTGYSSLGLLKNLPVDVIKIDRSFFTNNRFKTRAKAVLENVMQMAKRLEIHTVAEGVESKEHIDFLHELGCDIVQGFYYSAPVPAASFKLERTPQISYSLVKNLNLHLDEIGDLKIGRAEMGSETSVFSYRLFHVSVRKMLKEIYGEGEMAVLLRGAGKLAGSVFAKEVMDISLSFDAFIHALTEKLLEMKIGLLHVEQFDPETGRGVITVSDDLDCAGMDACNETFCQYDEGFLAGILKEYTKKNYSVIEVECWGTGAKICRFEVGPK